MRIFAACFINKAISTQLTSEKKISLQINNRRKLNEKDFEEDMAGGDLDIPSSELDYAMEAIESKDEENNHFGSGGDNHNDLEEKNGQKDIIK